MIVVLMLMNLRGVRESGTIFAIPTYAFCFGVFCMIGWGVIKIATGTTCRRPPRATPFTPSRPAVGGSR